MLEALGPGTRLGYCTNVHAGHDLDATLANLRLHAVRVRERLALTELGIGLWLSADAAHAALPNRPALRENIRAMGLRVFTLNGFPYTNFHEPVVKHRVYEPSWSDPRRHAYTLHLIDILHALLDEGEEGSISTLPIGWPGAPCAAVDLDVAAHALRDVAEHLASLESATGRLIHLDLEPEPGCTLQRSTDVVRLFERHLLLDHPRSEAAVRRHLRVCHDVCHAAVMFEPQRECFDSYAKAGIRVGKVQISSAPRAIGPAASQLSRFVEPRYLHQTSIKTPTSLRFFEDLPEALAATPVDPPHPPIDPAAEWRVHFHVPVHIESIGPLQTTQSQIREAITLARAHAVNHFEVETYAWTVLPDDMRPAELADGIAAELRWTAGAVA